MNLKLAQYKPVPADVMVVLNDRGDRFELAHSDQFQGVDCKHETALASSVEVLPLSLTACEGKCFRVNDAGADDDASVQIYLMCENNSDQYNIVRRQNSLDTILNEDALPLRQAVNIVAACCAIDWQCLYDNPRDIETVCVSNAVAIMEALGE